jgi:hypothetical protein
LYPSFPGQQQPFQPYTPGVAYPGRPFAGAPYAIRPTGDTAGKFYHIPPASHTKIIDTFKAWRDLLPKQSSPAATRALTLRGTVTPRRTIMTNVCNDPFWKERTGLEKIYPWATFQFLSIVKWEALGASYSAGGTNPIQFHPEWRDFIERLETLPVKIRRTPQSYFLNQMQFADKEKLPICGNPARSEVRFQAVQNGVSALQKLYADHVVKCWEILNELVIVVADPATKAEVVRLHPGVTSSTDSLDYVSKKAEAARKLLRDFYVAVEKTYQDSIMELQPV